MGLEINPLKDQPFGAEVVGLDLMHKPITSGLVSVVRNALLTHQVCVVSYPASKFREIGRAWREDPRIRSSDLSESIHSHHFLHIREWRFL